jgi:hypothetical protein
MLCFVVGDTTSEGRDVNGWNLRVTGPGTMRVEAISTGC